MNTLVDLDACDKALVLDCRRGDETAWEALIKRYRKLIYSIPRRAGLDQSLSSDVFQNVFAILVEKLSGIERPERIQAWLVTTTRRETWRLRNQFARTVSETDPIAQPISPYAATKIAGEATCHAYSHLYGMRILCLRFFTVYGARQRPDLAIQKFARLIDDGRSVPMFGDGASRRDYTYIVDIVAGLCGAIDYQESGFEIFNLGESETVELRRLIELLEQALGKRALIERRPSQRGDVPITYADISKARRLLGYNPRTKN